MKQELHVTALRVENSLYKRLAEIAKAEGRSVNQQIIWYIKKALEKQEQNTQKE